MRRSIRPLQRPVAGITSKLLSQQPRNLVIQCPLNLWLMLCKVITGSAAMHPRMLRALDIKSASVAEPLMAAANIIIENNDVAEKPITFLRRNSKWLRHLKVQETDCHRLWEVAVTQILLFPISSPSGGRAESFLVARSGPAGGSQKNRSFVGRSRRRRAARRRPFYLSGNGNPIGLRSINSVA